MKNLLIVTRKVDINDDILGFFHDWINAFASVCDHVTVICLSQGEHTLEKNVKVLSLGKEKGTKKITQLFRFFNLITRERANYDAVLVHTSPLYVVLGGYLWRMWGKKIALWYAHGSTPLMLKIANNICDIAFTSTPEGYRLKSEKKRIVGQGIDVDKFKPSNDIKYNNPVQAITVGRISPSKNLEIIIDALAILQKKGEVVPHVTILGDIGLPSQRTYKESLQKKVTEANLEKYISFKGAVANKDLPDILRGADFFLHTGMTGSLDKASLEAMATALPILTCNEAVASILGELAERLTYAPNDAAQLAEKIKKMSALDPAERRTLGSALRNIVVADHALPQLIEKITDQIFNVPDIASHFDRGASADEGYENVRWHKNSQSSSGYQMTETTIKNLVVPHILKSRSCLEVGAGPGTWSKYLLAANPKLDYTILDISSEMINVARKELSSLYPQVVYENKDFLSYTSSREYDFFFSSRALEYIDDKKKAVEIIYRSLASGGRGFIITKMPHYTRLRLAGRWVPSHHRGQIEPYLLTQMLQAQGCVDISVYPVTLVMPRVKSARMNRMLFSLWRMTIMMWPKEYFTESYGVMFKKP